MRGLYLWGGVGRGKTWLMDLFFTSLQRNDKIRLHFHRFMRRVHKRIAELGHVRDPLDQVAREMASQSRVLCFDEFFVSDIGDAMILGRLLRGLFANDVTLVATSNVAPRDLYRDGLQRAQFLPAIELLRQHTTVVHLDSDTDYRLRILKKARIYHAPLGADAERRMEDYFAAVAPGETVGPTTLKVNGRKMRAVRRARGVVWFTFGTLCVEPRSADDYVEIAKRFNTVFVSGIPVMDDEDGGNAARRFVNLVDEFYDRRVKLIVSAAAHVNGLYAGTRLSFEFRRTRSRLVEMQTEDYLSQQHLP